MGSSFGRYRFTRSSESVAGFLSQNRASTDAINALERWQRMEKNRCYDVEKDEDKEPVVRLTFDSSDEAAGSHLHGLCEKHGVSYQFLS